MNKTFKFSALAIAAALALTACDKKDANTPAAGSAPASAASAATDASSIGTPAQQASYAMGMDIGRSLKQMKDQGAEIDMKVFTEAMQSTYEGKESKMSEAQAQEVMMKFLTEQQTKAAEGVKTTASGLQYKITKEGDGKQPKKDDIVVVEYEGRLIDGTVFDSSKANGGPVTFPVSQVIPGWTEGIQLLKEGGEATFYIPSKLAYRDQPVPGGKIGPNSTLVFDVKLVKIGKPEDFQPAPGQVDIKKVQ